MKLSAFTIYCMEYLSRLPINAIGFCNNEEGVDLFNVLDF